MSNVWYKALLAVPPVVYGRRLLPFSLCHSLTLKEFKSPFLAGGPVALSDIYLASQVCSRTLAELRRDLFKITTRRAMLKWSLRWYRLRNKSAIAVDTIRQYIEDFSDRPVHEERDGKDESRRILASPPEYAMHRNLCALGYDPESAWDVSMSLAQCLYDVQQEFDGDTTLVPQWKVENMAVFAEANRLLELGKEDDANKLFAQCEQTIKEHS